jgi:site-specific DNA-methyltransferase (adenine-specific)
MHLPIVHPGDCRAVLRTLDPDSIDACVTDPPYGLGKEPGPEETLAMLRAWVDGGHYDVRSKAGFMGKEWDAFVPQPAVWKEVYRVLKPGAFVAAFFGTRTYDLGVMAMRLAEFEVRDMCAWVFGQGFPKHKTVLKPALEHAGARTQTQPAMMCARSMQR